MLTLVVFIVIVALLFDFINGFHDAANSIATAHTTACSGVSTRVETTVGKGVVEPVVIDQWVLLAGLAGAIVWDLITWYWGLPTSSSHALIGGFAGAAVIKAGFGSLVPA